VAEQDNEGKEKQEAKKAPKKTVMQEVGQLG
jgi:hypothetical protein